MHGAGGHRRNTCAGLRAARLRVYRDGVARRRGFVEMNALTDSADWPSACDGDSDVNVNGINGRLTPNAITMCVRIQCEVI